MDLDTFLQRVRASELSLLLDTDVVITLSCGGLIPVLDTCWEGDVYVTDTVATEIRFAVALNSRPVSCARDGLEAGWARDGVEMGDDDILDRVDEVRRLFIQHGDGPTKHAGEASTLVLAQECRKRQPHPRPHHDSKVIAVLQDYDARRVARSLDVRTQTIIELMNSFSGRRAVSCADLFDAYNRMIHQGRRLPGDMTSNDFCVNGCTAHP